ncbi:unnamed protein product [Clavelina lepadiformis]|uniref:Mediator of RNA polymerase II transcription subunit 16 n=1 Tax=Clavelina lepadiformis TaxID=159417 RepID=A0ABP0GCP1_CLALP
MEQIYKVGWPRNCNKLGHGENAVCAWSSSNLFAFTTEKEVNGYVKQFLNILNPNQPWDVFCSLYKGGRISCLKWDHTGIRLLSADSQGMCCVWTMNNHMSNVWSKKTKHCTELPGEYVLAVGWLHHGVRVLFHIDKMDVTSLYERFNRAEFKPSIMQYGGKHVDGYVAVTGTGLVCVKLLHSDNETTSCQVYLNVPCYQRLADVTFTSQGKIAVLMSDGVIEHYILFNELELVYDSEEAKLDINVNTLPSLPLKCASEEQIIYTVISHAAFVSEESQDHVLVCLSGPTGSKFESWLMKKEVVQLHRSFQQSTVLSGSSPENTKSWKYVTQSSHLAKVLNFSVSSLTMDLSSSENKISQDSNFFSGLYIAVALSDNTVQILHRIFLSSRATHSLPETEGVRNTMSSKKMKVVQKSCVQHVTFSPISCAIIAMDSSAGLLLYKVFPWNNAQSLSPNLSSQALQQVCQLLLYCLFTGSEWWDVLLLVQQNDADKVMELVNAEMNKQPSSVQQILHSRFLSLKITLHQMSSDYGAADCHIKLLFDAISLVFRSLVRPPQQVTSEENDPAVKLQNIGCTSSETDISKLQQNVDTDPQSLLSMQQLIQWVADVTLYLLASVPYHIQSERPGSSLLKDRAWLSVLRELLVIIRVWGLLKSACSPIFHVLDENIEVLPHIFHLITLLWQTSGEDNQSKELPESLIKECYSVPSQIHIPPLETVTPVNGVLSHMRHSSGVLRFDFGQAQPDMAFFTRRKQRMDFVAVPGSSGKIDSLQRLYLGNKPHQDLKECTRCGIVTMYNSLAKPTVKVWDQRFVRSCLCGGLWRKVGPTGLPSSLNREGISSAANGKVADKFGITSQRP